MAEAKQPTYGFTGIFQFMSSLYGSDLHTKRIYSLANATLSVMTGAALGVQTIGAALAQARGLFPNVGARVDLILRGHVGQYINFRHSRPQIFLQNVLYQGAETSTEVDLGGRFDMLPGENQHRVFVKGATHH
jgi:hypothetical protein